MVKVYMVLAFSIVVCGVISYCSARKDRWIIQRLLSGILGRRVYINRKAWIVLHMVYDMTLYMVALVIQLHKAGILPMIAGA